MRINHNSSTAKVKSRMPHRILPLIIAFSMFPLFFVSKTVITGFTQIKDKDKKEIKKISFDNEPVEITRLESDAKAIKLNEKFTQKDDWLKDFTIKFKNISDKPIVYLSIAIDFPETESTGYPMVYFLKYGVNPLAQKNGNDKPESLAPGDVTEVKLTAERHTQLKNFLSQRHLLADLTRADFRIMTVHFAGGTHWTAGTIYRPDPNRPGKFLAIDNTNQEEK
jgi:hypothetical protein